MQGMLGNVVISTVGRLGMVLATSELWVYFPQGRGRGIAPKTLPPVGVNILKGNTEIQLCTSDPWITAVLAMCKICMWLGITDKNG